MHLDKNLWRNGKAREHVTFLSCRGVLHALVWELLLKTCLECDFWTQLFSFPQETESDIWANSLQLGFYFHFYLFIYLFFYSLPFLWLSENNLSWEGGMIKTSLSKWDEWVPVSATLRLCTAQTCLLSISFKLPGYSWPIYNCAAPHLYARLVWNGFT